MHATPTNNSNNRAARNLRRGAIATALGGAMTLVSIAPAMAATPGEQLDAAIAGAQSQVAATADQVNSVASALQAGDVQGAFQAAAPEVAAGVDQAIQSLPAAPAIPEMPAAPQLPAFQAPQVPSFEAPQLPAVQAPTLPEAPAPSLPDVQLPEAGSSLPNVEVPEIPQIDISSSIQTGNKAVDDTVREIESAIDRTLAQLTGPTDEVINRPINLPGIGVIKRDETNGDFYLYPEAGYIGPKDLAFGFIGPDGNGHLGWVTLRLPGGATAGVGAGHGGIDVGVQGEDSGRTVHVNRGGAEVVNRGPAVSNERQAANNLTVNPSTTPTSDPTGGGDPYNPQNPTSPYNPDNPTSPYNPNNPDSPLYGDPEDRDAATRQADAIAREQAQAQASDPTSGAGGTGGDADEDGEDGVRPTELPGLRDVSDEDADTEETELVSLPGLRDTGDSTMTLAEEAQVQAEDALREGAAQLPGLASTTEPTPTTTPDAEDSDPTDPTAQSPQAKAPEQDSDADAEGDEGDEGMGTGAKVGIGAAVLAVVAGAAAAFGLRRKPNAESASTVTPDETK